MKKYLVGLKCGGIVEDSQTYYREKEIIEAESELESEKIYNEKHKCPFCYGDCLGEVLGGKVLVDVKKLL